MLLCPVKDTYIIVMLLARKGDASQLKCDAAAIDFTEPEADGYVAEEDRQAGDKRRVSVLQRRDFLGALGFWACKTLEPPRVPQEAVMLGNATCVHFKTQGTTRSKQHLPFLGKESCKCSHKAYAY